VILNDLAKYLVTWCVVQSLCDSWASCYCSSVFHCNKLLLLLFSFFFLLLLLLNNLQVS